MMPGLERQRAHAQRLRKAGCRPLLVHLPEQAIALIDAFAECRRSPNRGETILRLIETAAPGAMMTSIATFDWFRATHRPAIPQVEAMDLLERATLELARKATILRCMDEQRRRLEAAIHGRRRDAGRSD